MSNIKILSDSLSSLETAIELASQGTYYKRRPDKFAEDMKVLMRVLYFGRISDKEYDELTTATYEALRKLLKPRLDKARTELLEALKEADAANEKLS